MALRVELRLNCEGSEDILGDLTVALARVALEVAEKTPGMTFRDAVRALQWAADRIAHDNEVCAECGK